MSKAFTREGDGNSDTGLDTEDEAAEQAAAIPVGTKNYITPSGATRLRDELKRLLHVDRPEVVRTVSWAASNGDRSENGDYIYGKRRLREIDRRIRFLSKRLDVAEVVNPLTQRADRVLFGATVSVEDEEGQARRYQIVGIDETEVRGGRISWISPIGRALLQAKVGDAVTFRTPKGDEELQVLKIEYVAIE